MNVRKWLIIIGIILVSLLGLFFFVKLFPLIRLISSFIVQILLPFIIAGLFGFLLYPIVDQLEKWKINKIFALFIIYFISFGILFIIGYRGIPFLYEELQDLSKSLPELIDNYEQLIYSIYESTAFLPEAVHDQFDMFIIELERMIEKRLEKLLHHLINLFDYLFTIVMIPVILFYLLKDYESLKRYTISHIPAKYKSKTIRFVKAIHNGLGSYLRGQLIVSTIVFTLTYIIYYLLDLKYAFALSIFIGIMNIIPYFGPVIGMIPALLIAFAESSHLVIFVILTTIGIQIVEGVFLSPYVMGKSVRLHPLVIIFVLFCSVKIGGFLIMLIAIPLVTIIRAVVIELFPNKAMR